MIALTPETLAAISKALSTLHRAACLEVNAADGSQERSAAKASFVVGGAILMLGQSVDGQAKEWREFMYSIDGRLNGLHNAMLEMTKAIEHGVRVSDSEAEALRLTVLSGLAAIRDELAEIPGAISENGTDAGAGIALAVEQILKKLFPDDNTHND
jgi:hypothetical protein